MESNIVVGLLSVIFCYYILPSSAYTVVGSSITQFDEPVTPGRQLDIVCEVNVTGTPDASYKKPEWRVPISPFTESIGAGSDSHLQTNNRDTFGRTKFSFKNTTTPGSGNQTQVRYILSILHLLPTDGGKYQCGSNVTNLKVLDFAVTQENGTSAFLECDAAKELNDKGLLKELVWEKLQFGGSTRTQIASWIQTTGSNGTTNVAINPHGVTLDDIQADDTANYTCKIRYQNRTKISDYTWNIALTVLTPPNPPGKPQLNESTTTSLFIQWDSSIQIPGSEVANYTLQYMKNDTYVRYGWLDIGELLAKDTVGSGITSYNATSLDSTTSYVFLVTANNDQGSAVSDLNFFETQRSVPNDVHYTSPFVSFDSITIRWQTNGAIPVTHFIITVTSGDVTLLTNNRTAIDGRMEYSLRISDLQSDTIYCYLVQAINQAGASRNTMCSQIATDPKPPGAPIIYNAKQIAADNSTSTNAILIRFIPPSCAFQEPMSCITYYNLQYNQVQENLTDWVTVRVNVSEVTSTVDDRPHRQYKLLNLQLGWAYDLRISSVVQARFTKENTYMSNYSDIFTTTVLIAPPSPTFPSTAAPTTQGTARPTPDRSMADVIAAVVAVLVVAIIVIIVVTLILIRKKRRQSEDLESNEDLWIELNTPLLSNAEGYVDNDYESIGIDQWAEHCQEMHANTDIKFSEEYEQLLKGPPADITWKESIEPMNLAKNRYNNIVAYDHSRVLLKTLKTGELKTDYINANYIDSYDRQRAFIATQGPLQNTLEDFWRMVWEQNCRVIVMITNVYEKHKKKCEEYWPKSGTTSYGRLSVTHVKTDETAFWTVRTLTIRNNKVSKKKDPLERTIVQYHFTDWPDHGVPVYTLPVLSFVKRASDSNPLTAGPIVVHCSAGVGRSGTFICLDSMMKQIMQKRTANVRGFVKYMRSVRNHMVQTEEQYIFIHDALLHFIEGGGRTAEISPKKVRVTMEELDTKFDSSGETHLSKQFKTITKWKPSAGQTSAALQTFNQGKNRSEQFVPLDNETRVKLPRIPGNNGSDYINASYLHGYFHNQEFIITQHPSTQTEHDFWRMVWDQNSMTIVMLSNIGEEDMVTFYRPLQEPTLWETKSTFKLTYTEENLSSMDHAERTFLLESNQDDYEMQTKMFAITCWPEAYSSDNENVFQFVMDVNKWHKEKRNQAGPVIVIDKLGGKVAAQFCALYTLYNQYCNDTVVDIYSLAALYHKKRPGVWETANDYRFLYSSVVKLCDGDKSNNQNATGGNSQDSLDDVDHHNAGTAFANVRRVNTITRSPDQASRFESSTLS